MYSQDNSWKLIGIRKLAWSKKRFAPVLFGALLVTSILGCTRHDSVPAEAIVGLASNNEWTPFTRTHDGVEMALVPAGCFQMGSEDGEDDEVPVHTVCFDEPFWIDVYEVTNEAFGSTGCTAYSTEPAQPVTGYDWEDALAHCESRNARLPTEAEWEYAARGPDSLTYTWGNEFDGDCVVMDNPQSAEVGSNPDDVSWVGVFDMSGNVREWMSDWYDPAYYSAVTDGVINPQGPITGDQRVIRSGTFLMTCASYVRCANRASRYPFRPTCSDGFRCARSYKP